MRHFSIRSPLCLTFLACSFAVLSGSSLAAQPPDAPPQDTSELSMRLDIVPLQQASAADAANLLRAFLPDGSRVGADTRTNQVIVLSTEVGLQRATQILAAVDVPGQAVPKRGEQPTVGRPLYDYELRTQPYAVALREAHAGRDAPPMPFERTLGVLVARDAESITVARDGADAPTRYMLPKLRAGDDAWQVSGRLAAAVAGIEVGTRVAVEWWQADGVQYVEDIAALRTRSRRTETSILGD